MFIFDLTKGLYNKLTNNQQNNPNPNLSKNLCSNIYSDGNHFAKKHNLTINLDIINATNKSLKLYEEVNNKIKLQNQIKKMIDPEKALEEEYNDQLCKRKHKKNGLIIIGICIFLASFPFLNKHYFKR